MLFSHGARFGGHALYVKDRKLKYVYNFVGNNEQMVESTKPIPTGEVILGGVRARRRRRCRRPARSRSSSTTRRSGEGQIMTQPGNFSLVGEGLNVGRTRRAGHLRLRRHAPIRFTGGTIKEAIVDVSGEHYVDLEMEALAMMKRE